MDNNTANINQSSFFTASDKNICSFISNSKYRISFIGAGFSKKVAEALIANKELINVIVVDNDEMVYRSGYGEPIAIRMLQEEGIAIRAAKNIRMNILAIDSLAYAYTPVPLVIEDAPKDGNPGGIIVDYDSVKKIFGDIQVAKSQENHENRVPITETSMTKASTKEKNTVETGITETGLVVKNLPQKEVEEEVQKIEDNPPQFDLRKTFNVYTNKIQFMELQLKGFSLKKRTVKIPRTLLKFTKNDKKLKDQLNANYTIFPDASSDIVRKTETITNMVEELRKEYAVSLPKYGSVILISNRKRIDAQIKVIKKEIDTVKNSMEQEIKNSLEEAKKNIANILYPIVKRNPPVELTNFLDDATKLSKEDIMDFILYTLDEEFVRPKDIIDSMDLKYTYKDVTFEMIKSEEFREAVMKSQLKFSLRDAGLFSEQTAIGVKK